ncbi:hypothetical protein [Mucilaginibacter sp.]
MRIPVVNTPQKVEVFSTSNGVVYQCDAQNCWYVEFAGKTVKFNYRNLLRLKKAIYNIDIEALLLKDDRSPNLEIVFICASDACYVLSILQIIAFKDLLQGTFAMFELNHIIHNSLYRVSA